MTSDTPMITQQPEQQGTVYDDKTQNLIDLYHQITTDKKEALSNGTTLEMNPHLPIVEPEKPGLFAAKTSKKKDNWRVRFDYIQGKFPEVDPLRLHQLVCAAVKDEQVFATLNGERRQRTQERQVSARFPGVDLVRIRELFNEKKMACVLKLLEEKASPNDAAVGLPDESTGELKPSRRLRKGKRKAKRKAKKGDFRLDVDEVQKHYPNEPRWRLRQWICDGKKVSWVLARLEEEHQQLLQEARDIVEWFPPVNVSRVREAFKENRMKCIEKILEMLESDATIINAEPEPETAPRSRLLTAVKKRAYPRLLHAFPEADPKRLFYALAGSTVEEVRAKLSSGDEYLMRAVEV